MFAAKSVVASSKALTDERPAMGCLSWLIGLRKDTGGQISSDMDRGEQVEG